MNIIRTFVRFALAIVLKSCLLGMNKLIPTFTRLPGVTTSIFLATGLPAYGPCLYNVLQIQIGRFSLVIQRYMWTV